MQDFIQLEQLRKEVQIKMELNWLVKVWKENTCLSCGIPSENVSERCLSDHQRESHDRILDRPSTEGALNAANAGKKEGEVMTIKVEKQQQGRAVAIQRQISVEIGNPEAE